VNNVLTRVLLSVVLAASLTTVSAAPQESAKEKPLTVEKVKAGETNSVVIRGEKIGDSPVVALSEIMKDPEKYKDKKIIIEGTVDAVCQKKGCWMEVIPEPDEPGVRVTFKDYGFFVPKDAKGMKVHAEGKIKFTTLSKEDADHLEEEGARLVRNPDGTASELGFVASGVALYKVKE
jgi:hypothetical protein